MRAQASHKIWRPMQQYLPPPPQYICSQSVSRMNDRQNNIAWHVSCRFLWLCGHCCAAHVDWLSLHARTYDMPPGQYMCNNVRHFCGGTSRGSAFGPTTALETMPNSPPELDGGVPAHHENNWPAPMRCEMNMMSSKYLSAEASDRHA